MFLSLRLWSSLLLAPVALFKFVLLFWFVCSDMCVVLFVCIFVLGYQIQVLFGLNFHSFFFIYFFNVNLFSLQSCNRCFGLHAATLIFISCFCWLPCFDMGGNYSPVFIVMGPI